MKRGAAPDIHHARGCEAEDIKLPWVFEQGNLVQLYARRSFPGGQLGEGHSEMPERQTQELMAAGVTTIFQAMAIAEIALSLIFFAAAVTCARFGRVPAQ